VQVCLVFIAVAAVIVYRIIMTVDYCVLTSPAGCLLLTSVFSAVLNAAAILILGKVRHVQVPHPRERLHCTTDAVLIRVNNGGGALQGAPRGPILVG